VTESTSNDNEIKDSESGSCSMTGVIEAWNTTVQVQKHFNELQLKQRNFAITLFVAISGAAGYAFKEHIMIVLFDMKFAASALITMSGLVLLIALYTMDYGYHRLLIAAVKHGMMIENLYKDSNPELGLATCIKDGSPFRIIPWWLKPWSFFSSGKKTSSFTLTSSLRLHLLYWTFLVVLSIATVAIFLQSNAESTIATDNSLLTHPETGDLVKSETEALRLYYDSGKYTSSIEQACRYGLHILNNTVDQPGSQPIAIFDIDETVLSTWPILDSGNFCWDPDTFERFVMKANAAAITPVLHFYKAVQDQGISVVFITGRRERYRLPTELNLQTIGYTDYKTLIMVPNDWSGSAAEYKTNTMKLLQLNGNRIVMTVGDQLTDHPDLKANQQILIPNPFYTTN